MNSCCRSSLTRLLTRECWKSVLRLAGVGSEHDTEGKRDRSSRSGQAQGWSRRAGNSEVNLRREESGHVVWTAQAISASRYQRLEFTSELYAGRDRRHDS